MRLEVPRGEDGVALGAQDTATVTIEDADSMYGVTVNVAMAMNYWIIYNREREKDSWNRLNPLACTVICSLASIRSSAVGPVV